MLEETMKRSYELSEHNFHMRHCMGSTSAVLNIQNPTQKNTDQREIL